MSSCENCGDDDAAHQVCLDCMSEIGGLSLDMLDPIDSTVAEILLMFRSKAKDYARIEDRWSNFRHMAQFMGQDSSPWMSALVLCQQKLSRISALSANGRTPENDSVLDSVLDNAVYAVIALAMMREAESGKSTPVRRG